MVLSHELSSLRAITQLSKLDLCMLNVPADRKAEEGE